MASIYARGDVLWMKFKNKAGKPECRSTGYRVGQETQARELATEVERQATIERDGSASRPARFPFAASSEPKPTKPTRDVLPMPSSLIAETAPSPVAPVDRIGPDAAPGALTVRDYGEEWLLRRVDVASVKDEIARLRLHVFPLIGHMAIADVRPKHIRDLINAIKQKTIVSPRCKGGYLAPRTVRLVFATLRVMFKSAMIDEHITASPTIVEKGVLPKNVDKDPEWRSTAIFEREELIAIVSDPRIGLYRRVIYALEGIAGVRHGEAAGLRWRDHNEKFEPLTKLVVSRSGEKKRTKTQQTREIPVHPSLATILAEWKATGWAEKYGREPTPDDLVLPTEKNKVRKPSNTLKEFKKDLKRIGLRARRGHDLRRTFVTLTRVDGGRAEVLRPLTHPGEKDIIGLYTTFPWPVICAEILKLRIPLPGASAGAPTGGSTPSQSGGEPAGGGGPIDGSGSETARAAASDQQIAAPGTAAVAGYTASYSPECSSEMPSDSESLDAVAAMGQRFRNQLPSAEVPEPPEIPRNVAVAVACYRARPQLPTI